MGEAGAPPPPPPKVDVAAMGEQVVSLLRGQWTTGDLAEYGITVTDDIVLIKTDLNKYDGLVSVTTRNGTEKFLGLNMWADTTGAMFYNMDVSSATNLMEAAKDEEPNRCWAGYC